MGIAVGQYEEGLNVAFGTFSSDAPMLLFVCACHLEETTVSFLDRVLRLGEALQQSRPVYRDVRDGTRVTTVLDTDQYESTYRSTRDSPPVLPLEYHIVVFADRGEFISHEMGNCLYIASGQDLSNHLTQSVCRFGANLTWLTFSVLEIIKPDSVTILENLIVGD